MDEILLSASTTLQCIHYLIDSYIIFISHLLGIDLQ